VLSERFLLPVTLKGVLRSQYNEYSMRDNEITRTSSDRLEQAISALLGPGKSTGTLSQLLAYAAQKSTVSYQEIKEIIKDDPEDVLLLADEWRLLLTVSTTKSSSWEDRLLALKDGEIYEIPNIIRYLLQDGLHTGRWEPEKAIGKFFKELGDPNHKQIPGLVRSISEKAVNHRITGNQIKMICLQFGLSNRVDVLIAELKAAGIISPRLRSVPEVNKEGSPIYEINPSVTVVLSP
jgi:hypothetical protein